MDWVVIDNMEKKYQNLVLYTLVIVQWDLYGLISANSLHWLQYEFKILNHHRPFWLAVLQGWFMHNQMHRPDTGQQNGSCHRMQTLKHMEFIISVKSFEINLPSNFYTHQRRSTV